MRRARADQRRAADRGALVAALAVCATMACGGDGKRARDAAAPEDARVDDARMPDVFVPPRVDFPSAEDEAAELLLSQVGLYREIADKTLAPDLIAFEPAYALWSDGAQKSRWLRLPAGTALDTKDVEHFSLPVGGVLFKEFRAPDGRRLETRVVARTGAGERDYFMGAFVWNDDESDARYAFAGAENVRGTEHDVPAAKKCSTCHAGEPGRMLGLSAVQQLAQGATPGLLALEERGLFSQKVSDRVRDQIPGNDVERAALGYLHANCGHCHNPGGSARPDTDMHLRLYPNDARVKDTAIYRSTVGVALQNFMEKDVVRIAAGDPMHSAVLVRMQSREEKVGMPPIATEKLDEDGIRAVRAFIEAL